MDEEQTRFVSSRAAVPARGGRILLRVLAFIGVLLAILMVVVIVNSFSNASNTTLVSRVNAQLSALTQALAGASHSHYEVKGFYYADTLQRVSDPYEVLFGTRVALSDSANHTGLLRIRGWINVAFDRAGPLEYNLSIASTTSAFPISRIELVSSAIDIHKSAAQLFAGRASLALCGAEGTHCVPEKLGSDVYHGTGSVPEAFVKAYASGDLLHVAHFLVFYGRGSALSDVSMVIEL